MRKTFFTLAIVFLSLSFSQCTSNEKALHKKLSEMAIDLNASAPVMLDEFTRFDGAMVTRDNTFQYRYTVLNTSNPDSLVEQSLHGLRKNMKEAFSTNPQLRIFKENNVSIEYIYNDENNRTIRLIEITPNDYQ